MDIERIIFLHEEISKGHALIALTLKNEKKGKHVPDEEFRGYVKRVNDAQDELTKLYATAKR